MSVIDDLLRGSVIEIYDLNVLPEPGEPLEQKPCAVIGSLDGLERVGRLPEWIRGEIVWVPSSED